MKTFTRIFFILAALAAASVAHAQRAPVPIIDKPSVPVVTGSGKPASDEALKKAIIDGGAAGPRKWSIGPAGDGKTLRGTYMVRAHVVVVHIVPRSNSYSVKYADSTNMTYGVENGTPVIHPFYNQWVDQLIHAINHELTKL